jgi:hypothetical protein
MTEAQDLNLRLIGLSGEWNSFKGPAIESALRSHLELWRAALFASETYAMPAPRGFLGLGKAELRLGDRISLVVLRDLPKGGVAHSTLFLLSTPGRQGELFSLANGWEADEVHWFAQDEAFEAMGESPQHDRSYADDPERVILRCWWD